MPRYQAQVVLLQLLFDGFNREGAVDRHAARRDAAALRVLERTEATALDVVEAYLDVLRNQALVMVATENVAAHRATLNKVRQRVTGGQSGTGDLQQATSRLATARDAEVQVGRDLAEARTRYQRVVNDPPHDLIRPEVPRQYLPAGVENGVQQAVQKSPTMKAAVAELDETHALYRQAGAGFYPTFKFEVSAATNRNLDGVRGLSNEAMALLRMNLNLFCGEIDRNVRMELAERITENRAKVMRIERSIAQEVRLSWTAMESAKSRVMVLNDEALANAQVVAAYRQEFDIGQRNLLDLLDAENELFSSRSRLLTAEFTEDFGVFRTLAAIGGLLGAIGVTPPSEADSDARTDVGVTSDSSDHWRGEDGLLVPFVPPSVLPVPDSVQTAEKPQNMPEEGPVPQDMTISPPMRMKEQESVPAPWKAE
ncbi:MAG: outer membrane protein LapE [Rhodospirillaceae bacterium]|nr:MAG: outer membrane protein LapE [Rhodospirillaceae bacterium]